MTLDSNFKGFRPQYPRRHFLDHRGVVNRRQQVESAAAARAGEDVDRGLRSVGTALGGTVPRLPHGAPAAASVGREDPVVQGERLPLRLDYLQVGLLLWAGEENKAMLSTVRAVVREGRIELLERVDLPEGSKLLVTVLPDEEAGFWLDASGTSLDRIWDNREDDVYACLLDT